MVPTCVRFLVIAIDLAGACRLPPAFRRPKRRRREYYADPPKKALGRMETMYTQSEGTINESIQKQ